MSQPVTPSIPQLLTPVSNLTYTSPVTITWTHTLQNYAVGSFYLIYIADNVQFNNPTIRKVSMPYNPPNSLDITLSNGDWNIKIEAVAVVYKDMRDGPALYTYSAGFSSPRAFKVSATASTTDNAVVEDNLNTYVPIVLGKFDYSDVTPLLDNGLAIAYLTKFGTDVVYTICDHGVNSVPTPSLWMPAEGDENTVIRIIPQSTTVGGKPGVTQFTWVPINGMYTAQKEYALSTAPLAAPFAGASNSAKWRALNYAKVLDNDPNTYAGLQILEDSQHVSYNVNGQQYNDGWDTHIVGAWEVDDKDQSFLKLAKDNAQIYVLYNNVNMVTLPENIRQNYTGDFKLCVSVNSSAMTENVNHTIPNVDGTTNKHGVQFNVGSNKDGSALKVGPLKSADLGDMNRNPALFLDVRSWTVANRLSGTPVTLGEARLQLTKAYNNIDQAKQFKVFAGLDGAVYGSWVTSFLSDSGLGSYIKNQYNAGNALTIEEGAMMLAWLLVVRAGVSVSDFDTTSFSNAIKNQSMRINVTDESTTIGDLRKTITQQCAFNCDYTPSGKVKCMNVRTATSENTVDATILYQDIEASTFNLQLTPLDKVVNTITVKSRFHAQSDKFIDTDTYINSASVAKYGTKKLESPLEFKNLNAGPHARDSHNNSTTVLVQNPVKYQIVHLIDPDIQNGQTDTNKYATNDGWWANQHADISFTLPGYKFMSLEKGDIIMLDDSTFQAQAIKCFGASWSTKYFMIQSITKNQDGVIINSAVELPQYNMITLRNLNLLSRP